MADLRAEYEKRLAARSARAARLERWQRGLWWVQLSASLLLALALILAAHQEITAAWIFVPLLGAIGAHAAESRMASLRGRSLRAARMYGAALARLDGRWEAAPFTGAEFIEADHVNAFDLDIVGERSLFARLNTARTQVGARTLAVWLVEPAQREARRKRQVAVAELRGRLDLREALHTAGTGGVVRVCEDLVAAWGRGEARLPWPRARVPLRVAAWALVASSVGTAVGWWGIHALVATAALNTLLHALFRARVNAVAIEVLEPLGQLSAAAAVMAVLEKEEFGAPLLRELQAALRRGGRASRRVARLGRLVTGLLAMRTELVAFIGFPLLWPARKALAIEAWRRAHGGELASWLRAVGAIEALCSIATWADEHPTCRQAEVVEDGLLFDAEGLCHPLLPEGCCVPNDVRLGESGASLLLLSGSNMSGKSTLLRAVGMSAAMALAGIPVRATRLRLSPVLIGASIRARDSILDGESRFYAELKRLKQVVRLVDDGRRVLFLLDEILGGTNSHDRLGGASGLLRGLVGRGAVGICSTHDLALTQIVDELGARAANAHFGDRLEGDRLVFDYRLREGASRQTNAMELMRAIGLHG